MAVQANFAVIPFGEHIGDNADDLNMPWVKFVGNQSSLHAFDIGARPVGHSYLLMQTYQVDVDTHALYVNGAQLTGLNIPIHNGWETWMVVLKDDVLRIGQNTIQFIRDTRTADDFVIGNVVVHWQEFVV